jgi:hypothetical protein
VRFTLAILPFLLPAAAALADEPAGPGDGVTVARVAVLGGEFGSELLRFGTGSHVFLGNDDTLPVVIIADPRGQSGGQPNPDLFHRTLRGCRPGSNVSCCFDNGGLTPPSQWFFTLYGWINSDRSCRSNLEQTTSPTDIEPPLADEIVLYSGIDNAFLTTAGLRGQIRVLHVHDTKHTTKATCGRVPNICNSAKSGQLVRCGRTTLSTHPGNLWAYLQCNPDSKAWAKLPDQTCDCLK